MFCVLMIDNTNFNIKTDVTECGLRSVVTENCCKALFSEVLNPPKDSLAFICVPTTSCVAIAAAY